LLKQASLTVAAAVEVDWPIGTRPPTTAPTRTGTGRISRGGATGSTSGRGGGSKRPSERIRTRKIQVGINSRFLRRYKPEMFYLDHKKKDNACPLWISDDLEFWPESAPKFVQIASLYSELIALSTNGQIFQWRWNDSEPYRHPEVKRRLSNWRHFEKCFPELEHPPSQDRSFEPDGREGCPSVSVFDSLFRRDGKWEGGHLARRTVGSRRRQIGTFRTSLFGIPDRQDHVAVHVSTVHGGQAGEWGPLLVVRERRERENRFV
jgi:hypothetical protein